VRAENAERLARRLLAEPEVAPAGLGARDSLRLEAGLPLYGHDIDELTTPVEAGLVWTIGKRRRINWDFPGAVAIRDQLDNGAPRHRVGLLPDGRAPVRAGTTLVAGDGTAAGSVTSGTFSPTRDAPIAMGYVRRDLAADGTQLYAMLRGKPVPTTVAPLPFVAHRYSR
jgi:aminomethyltransferase